MDSFQAIIDSFGTAVLAGYFGVEESHVRTMKTRDSIPPEYWDIVVEKWPGPEPLTHKTLLALRGKRFRRRTIGPASAEGSAA